MSLCKEFGRIIRPRLARSPIQALYPAYCRRPGHHLGSFSRRQHRYMPLLDLLPSPAFIGLFRHGSFCLPIPNNSVSPALASVIAGSKASFRPAGPLLPTPFSWTASGYGVLEAPLNSVSPLLSLRLSNVLRPTGSSLLVATFEG